MTTIDTLTTYQFGWLTAVSCGALVVAIWYVLWKTGGFNDND